MQNLLRRLTTQQLAAVILFVLLFALAVRIPVDTDTWWHLRSGEYILNHGSVPLTDPFSLTRLGQPWIDQSWGSQVIMEVIYKLFGGSGQAGDGGNVGLALYTALLATGGMLLVYRSCEGNVYLRAFVMVLAASTAAVFWSARPQMMSFFLSAVILYLLYLYKRRKQDRLWLIPLIMVVWVNLHAGYSIGFLLLGGTIVGEVLGRLFDKANPDVLSWRQIGKLLAATVIAYIALVINPNTTQMWTYSFRTVDINFLQQHIQEWASPNFHDHETWPFLILLLGTFAAVGLSGKRLDWTDLILTSAFAALSVYAGRNISSFAIVAAPVLARHLDALAREHGLHIPPSRPPRGIAVAINWVLLLLIVLGAGLKIALVLNPKTVAAAQTAGLPVEAADYLNSAKPAGPMFNSYNWGGYLMFAAPSYPVFVDGRTDLYDDTLLNQWLAATQAQNWQQTFEQWGIRLVVIEKDSPLAQTLRQNPEWTEAHADDLASVFVQKAS
jgi:hypothetical protein